MPSYFEICSQVMQISFVHRPLLVLLAPRVTETGAVPPVRLSPDRAA
jgi:hypothetical protein